jgi:predicted secreted protein with PEFG-CTERM motif
MDDNLVGVSGTDFMVGFEITGGKLISITPDVDANSLIIAIDAFDDGQLTITLPRELIDAKIGDDDDDYFVLVDGEEVDFDETTTSTDRTLVISFPAGAEEIEIIGTFVVPEFGAIAALILAVAIISIIAVSAKSRLSIMPRY